MAAAALVPGSVVHEARTRTLTANSPQNLHYNTCSPIPTLMITIIQKALQHPLVGTRKVGPEGPEGPTLVKVSIEHPEGVLEVLAELDGGEVRTLILTRP